MNNIEKTFWNMQKDCIRYATDNRNIWATFPVIEISINKLIENELEIIGKRVFTKSW